MNIVYKKQAVKYINSCDSQTKRRLKKAIELLPSGDVVKLKGYDTEYLCGSVISVYYLP